MAITFVAHDELRSTNSNSVTTAGVDTTGANLIVLTETIDGASVTPTDSKLNTWTGLTVKGSVSLIRLYYCLNPIVGSAHTFSISAVGHFPSIAMQAFSLTSAFDKETGAAATQPGSLTPTGNNEVLITAGSHSAVGVAPTVDVPFSTNLTASLAGTANAYAVGMAYEIQTTATARNPTWTLSTNPLSVMAAFTASSGGPFPHYTRRRMHGGTLGMSGGARMRTDEGDWHKTREGIIVPKEARLYLPC